MSRFYQRYVPPRKHSVNEPAVVNIAESYKHNRQDDSPREPGVESSNDVLETLVRSRDGANKQNNQDIINGVDNGKNVLNKYSISTFAKSQDEDIDITPRRNSRKRRKMDNEAEVSNKDKEPEAAHGGRGSTPPGDSENGSSFRNHSTILHKYGRSKLSRLNAVSEDNSAQEDIMPNHGLLPIPQPESHADAPFKLSYSTQPSWQANPTRVTSSTNLPFDQLGLGARTLSNLESRGIQQAFTVQSTIIPLLMRGSQAHKGDVCVSAATGSGKTLAYVLPIIESLSKSTGSVLFPAKSGLRAVIVVPTRELVKQVRETCEMCAAGVRLTIATAQGGKSLLKEQKSLVETNYVYDPETYQRESDTPIDWSNFSLLKVLEKARHRDPSKVVNYIERTKVKPDILITTPGRLVEHLQNTDGFHLHDVEWLVIDEADRLLNESYQEWLSTIKPALASRKATEKSDRIFRHMRMELPPRIVRKVLLSATMTSDISKLNEIGLNNPRLVILESTEAAAQQGLPMETDIDEPAFDSTGKYALPTSLHEFAIPLKEGSEKPMFLLKLLEKHLRVISNESPSTETESSSDESDSVHSSSSKGASLSEESSTDHIKKRISLETASGQRASRVPVPSSSVRTLIFTRSTASASRLSRLLSLLSPRLSPLVVTLTRSTVSSPSSRKALSSFQAGKTPILIATDRASRGIDIPGLEHVVSYDIPGSALTYVHRVGRTARAGKEGNAWTLVEHREGKWFWQEIGGKSTDSVIQRAGKVKRFAIEIDDEDLRQRYEGALQTLGSEVRDN